MFTLRTASRIGIAGAVIPANMRRGSISDTRERR